MPILYCTYSESCVYRVYLHCAIRYVVQYVWYGCTLCYCTATLLYVCRSQKAFKLIFDTSFSLNSCLLIHLTDIKFLHISHFLLTAHVRYMNSLHKYMHTLSSNTHPDVYWAGERERLRGRERETAGERERLYLYTDLMGIF